MWYWQTQQNRIMERWVYGGTTTRTPGGSRAGLSATTTNPTNLANELLSILRICLQVELVPITSSVSTLRVHLDRPWMTLLEISHGKSLQFVLMNTNSQCDFSGAPNTLARRIPVNVSQNTIETTKWHTESAWWQSFRSQYVGTCITLDLEPDQNPARRLTVLKLACKVLRD